jgi:hypothetical protein
VIQRQSERTATVIALTAAVALAVPTAASATLQTTYYKSVSCTAGGFTGTIWFVYIKRSTGEPRYIGQIKYKINKGTNRGGNQANVYWADGATAPTTYFNTDHGIQDNQYHLFGGDYYRGIGVASMKFVFDKSRATDPSCVADTIRR